MDEKTTIPGLFRAEKTGALINKDNKSLEAYKKRRQAAKLLPLLETKINLLENVINKLEARIKALETKE